MHGIQAPARAGGLQPAAQAFQPGFVQPGRLGDRRAGQQVEDLVQAEARQRQAEQAQEHFGQRLAGQRAGVGQRVGQRVVAAMAPEHRLQVRRVRVDVRRKHRDLARLQRRIETRVVEQRAQLVVQHLQFAQAGMAGVQLQAGIDQIHLRQRWRHGRRAAMEQVALHAPQQAVAEAAGGERALAGGQRIGVDRDLGQRMHHFVIAEQRHEVAPGRAPGLQQRVFLHLRGEQVDRAILATALPQRLQVAPVALGRRGQVEVQRAHARLSGEDAQYVGRDVEDGEGEQPRRQALRQRAVGLRVAVQILADAARAVLAAAGDPAPQPRLRIVGIGAAFPAQQPVAAPGLVFFEHVAQLAGQRPGFERVAIGQVAGQRCQRRIAAGIGLQCRVQPPLRGGHVQIVGGRAEVGVQRARDEFAGRQEFQIRGDAVRGRQRGLQPAPHRHLRDQHHLRHQQRLLRHRPAQFLGEQGGQGIQRVGGVQAEIGRGRGVHACGIVPDAPVGRRCAMARPAAVPSPEKGTMAAFSGEGGPKGRMPDAGTGQPRAPKLRESLRAAPSPHPLSRGRGASGFTKGILASFNSLRRSRFTLPAMSRHVRGLGKPAEPGVETASPGPIHAFACTVSLDHAHADVTDATILHGPVRLSSADWFNPVSIFR